MSAIKGQFGYLDASIDNMANMNGKNTAEHDEWLEHTQS